MIPILVEYKVTTQVHDEVYPDDENRMRDVETWERGVWVATIERTNRWKERYTSCVVCNFATRENVLVHYSEIRPIGILDMNDMTVVAEAVSLPGRRIVKVRRPHQE